MKTNIVARASVGATILALVLASGCSAPSSQREARAPSSPQGGPSSASVAPAASFTTPMPGSSPLSSLLPKLNEISQRLGQDDGTKKKTFEARQASIAGCMKEQGFEYHPLDYVAAGPPAIPAADEMILPALGDQATVEAHGYGTLAPQGNGGLPETSGERANTEYVDSLSTSTRRAYELALTGHDLDDRQTFEDVGGCTARAETEHPEPAVPAESTESQLLGIAGEIRRLQQEDIFADPTVSALNEEWRECMQERGFDLEQFSNEAANLSAQGPMAAINLAIITDAGGNRAPATYDRPTAELPEGQRSLSGTPQEIDIAVADYQCRLDTEYEKRFTASQIALEEQFVAEREREIAELDAFLQSGKE